MGGSELKWLKCQFWQLMIWMPVMMADASSSVVAPMVFKNHDVQLSLTFPEQPLSLGRYVDIDGHWSGNIDSSGNLPTLSWKGLQFQKRSSIEQGEEHFWTRERWIVTASDNIQLQAQTLSWSGNAEVLTIEAYTLPVHVYGKGAWRELQTFPESSAHWTRKVLWVVVIVVLLTIIFGFWQWRRSFTKRCAS
jgi:hypothetical protein